MVAWEGGEGALPGVTICWERGEPNDTVCWCFRDPRFTGEVDKAGAGEAESLLEDLIILSVLEEALGVWMRVCRGLDL